VDGTGSAGGLQASFPVLTSDFFLPGEVDVSSLGVPLTDLAGAGLAGATDPAPTSDNMLIVSNNGSCPNAQYTSIQEAVQDALPGAKIKVCPGTYPEQVTIDKPDLTLFSEIPLEAIIQAPPDMTPPNSIVSIEAPNTVLRQFTISGPFTYAGCTLPEMTHTGVRVFNGGTATIYGNHITKIENAVQANFGGCQDGIGVLVGRNILCQTGIATITHNQIDNYQKGGIVVDGFNPALLPQGNPCTAVPAGQPTESFAEISQNQIDGGGLTAVIARNGIQVSRGAGADLDHNIVSANYFVRVGLTDTAAGVLLYYPLNGSVTVDKNDAVNNGIGIDVDEGTSNEVIDHNDADQNHDDGVGAFMGSAGNYIQYNKASGTAPGFDCYDETGGPFPAATANYWIHDMGITENRPDLCKQSAGS
jgi:hypothetical protein